MEENRQSLPFDERYITQIIEEIEDYKKSFEITLNVSKKPEITKVGMQFTQLPPLCCAKGSVG